jgi:phage terminase small subunit
MPATPLTPSQERFCQEYLIDLNATRAYKAAYPTVSLNSANAAGSRLLANVKVAARIRDLQAQRARRTAITQDWVLERLKQNVERAMAAEPVLDHEGQPTGEYRYDGAVANGALKLLGQHLGMYTERAVVDHRYIAEVPPKAADAATWASQHRRP